MAGYVQSMRNAVQRVGVAYTITHLTQNFKANLKLDIDFKTSSPDLLLCSKKNKTNFDSEKIKTLL